MSVSPNRFDVLADKFSGFADKFAGRFSSRTIVSAVAGIAVAGAGVTTALAYGDDTPPAPPKAQQFLAAAPQDDALAAPKKVVKKAQKKKLGLPSGVATGTSFWDPETASGKPMSYHTLASPYWPLGTKVKITYKGKSVIGIVEDFGPAEWAVAQHNPPAIIDLSEKMMEDFTGVRSNSVPIKFQVLEFGKGGVYRHSGTGHDIATKMTGK